MALSILYRGNYNLFVYKSHARVLRRGMDLSFALCRRLVRFEVQIPQGFVGLGGLRVLTPRHVGFKASGDLRSMAWSPQRKQGNVFLNLDN